MKRERSVKMVQCVEEAQKCELCGSKRGLEAHHIIPLSLGGDDSVDNLICVCVACHSRLTPRKILTKNGMERRLEQNRRIANSNRILESNIENAEIECEDDLIDAWERAYVQLRDLYVAGIDCQTCVKSYRIGDI